MSKTRFLRIGIDVDETTLEQLNSLTSAYNLSRPKLMSRLIQCAYDELQGHPTLKKNLKALQDLEKMLTNWSKKNGGNNEG